MGERPYQLLRAVAGIDLVDLPDADQCCGFGGTFAVKNADVPSAMCADKVVHVRQTEAEVLVAGDSSCLMHIDGMLTRTGAPVQVMHLAEILASTAESPQQLSGEVWLGARGTADSPAEVPAHG